MGIKLIARDTTAPWTSVVVPPVTRGLEAWFTFDTDAARFTFNRAMGKPNAILVGAPVAYPTHGRFKGLSNYLQTPIAETDEQTIFAVYKCVLTPTNDATSGYVVGNFRGKSRTPGREGQDSSGVTLYAPASGLVGKVSRHNGAGAVAFDDILGTGMTPATSWSLRAIRTKSGQVSKVFDFTAGVSIEGVTTAARDLADTKLRIGSGTAFISGECDISSVAIYSSYLTDDEIAQVAAVMRKRMTRLGVAV
jgi:ribosomal protein L24